MGARMGKTNKKTQKKAKSELEKAVFGAGCFWHVQYSFSKLKGVAKTTAGYMGGDEKNYPNPKYEMLHSDKTGYAETVLVEFDPKKTSYNKLLDVFWEEHDPTTPNRSGPDRGTQYRSIIFYYDESQKKMAEASKKEQQKKYSNPIVTEIVSARKHTFYKAEEYHQNYFIKTGQRVCPANLKL
jgi:peptide-methionine (S)-S-oxide reductase